MTKGHCKHGEFELTEGCPQCIAERQAAEAAAPRPGEAEMSETIKCPSGHIVDVTTVQSYVDLTKPDIDDAITFDCPGGKRGHRFSLKKAVAAGTFTEDQAGRIREIGKAHRAMASRYANLEREGQVKQRDRGHTRR